MKKHDERLKEGYGTRYNCKTEVAHANVPRL